jgi:hypothetical protein
MTANQVPAARARKKLRSAEESCQLVMSPADSFVQQIRICQPPLCHRIKRFGGFGTSDEAKEIAKYGEPALAIRFIEWA